MSRDKQIEEMCEVLRKNAESCKTCDWYAEGLCIGNCELAEDNQTVCETLYNAGYRKIYDDNQRQCTCYALGCLMAEQLEKKVAEKIFAEIENNAYTYGINFVISKETLAELKNKYTEEGK
jgi:hypothetical protein